MFGFKLLAVAALAWAVVAQSAPQDSACASAVTVTVTQPLNPAPTPPGPHYSPPPATIIESTATAALSGAPSSGIPIAPAPPSTGVPVAPSSAGAPASPSSGEAPSETASASGTAPANSSAAAATHPTAPAQVSTAGAALVTPLVGLGSLVAAGAAAMAVVV